MDDEIMRKMGGDKIQAVARLMMSKEQLEEMTFTQKQFTASIQRAQKQMEGWHFSSRKHLFDYDSVINKQRERIYAKRDAILEKQRDDAEKNEGLSESDVVELDVYDEVKASIDDVVDTLITTYTAYKPWNITELLEELSQIT
jgi:preprotein translocase subunit SecA